jgi:fructan beta-fructosidase
MDIITMLMFLRKIYSCFLVAFLLLACGSRSHPETYTSLHEKYRPQVHFSPLKNRMDNPTGLVYYEGEYHLFSPYNANGNTGKLTHWGHAVSSDLIHWEHLPEALSPDSLGAIFSGSVVADLKNTSGFGTADNPPLVAVFTYHNYDVEASGDICVETQGIAYSLDRGRTWVKYDHNPVIPNPGIRDFGEPKVIWHEPTQRWVMVLAAAGRISFYTSADLKNWDYASDFGKELGNEEIWHYPDLFELPVSNSKETQWVLITNVGFVIDGDWTTGYFTGSFDGRTFSSSQITPFWMDYGKDNYAGTTFNNTPDNRRVLMGWMNNPEYAMVIPTLTWRGAFTIPRELGLEKTHEHYLLTVQPVKEIEGLYGQSITIQNITTVQDIHSSGITNITEKISFPLLPSEIYIRFKTDNMAQIGFAEKFGIRLKNKYHEYVAIGYDNFHHKFYADRTHSTGEQFSEAFAGIHILPYNVYESETVDMHIIFDVTSFELFAMEGKAVITDTFFPTSDFDTLEIFAENGKITVESISITQLKSIWE